MQLVVGFDQLYLDELCIHSGDDTPDSACDGNAFLVDLPNGDGDKEEILEYIRKTYAVALLELANEDDFQIFQQRLELLEYNISRDNMLPITQFENTHYINWERDRNKIANRCSCGRVYTLEQFYKLDYVGETHIAADENGPEEFYQLRNCPCHSTRSALWVDGELYEIKGEI